MLWQFGCLGSLVALAHWLPWQIGGHHDGSSGWRQPVEQFGKDDILDGSKCLAAVARTKQDVLVCVHSELSGGWACIPARLFASLARTLRDEPNCQ